VKSISLGEDVLSVRYFPNGKYYAVSLLDLSIRIFYSDSDKEYLSLYGHKLAVHCMDISSDCTLLASGSNDKNIRLWGLDYGDCKKSIFAHNGAVSSLSFIRDTHYLLSTGKDGVSKHWDGDTYE
jgi:U3 small nucleolar RNA-associated protein 12